MLLGAGFRGVREPAMWWRWGAGGAIQLNGMLRNVKKPFRESDYAKRRSHRVGPAPQIKLNGATPRNLSLVGLGTRPLSRFLWSDQVLIRRSTATRWLAPPRFVRLKRCINTSVGGKPQPAVVAGEFENSFLETRFRHDQQRPDVIESRIKETPRSADHCEHKPIHEPRVDLSSSRAHRPPIGSHVLSITTEHSLYLSVPLKRLINRALPTPSKTTAQSNG